MVSLEQSEVLAVGQDQKLRRYLRPITIFSKQSPIGAVAGVFLVVVAIMAAAAPLAAPFHPLEADFAVMTASPDGAHPLGTDPLGRDTLSRIIYGARYTLMVAFSAVLLGTTFGAVLGVASAYLGGKFDLGVQRVLEVLQAFPDLILALLLMVALGPGLGTVIIAIAVTRIPFGGRVVRSVALQIREMDYVTAARAVGVSSLRIMRLHVAPQCIAPYLVLATAHLGVAIIIEASLGYLGVGIPPPTPTWGNMLAMQGNNLIPPWWLVVYPGVAITLIVLAFSLFGDGLRDYLDPRLRGRL
jgi:ABC-type dipeptide/oligopeptide/nickel transport system permease subunit